MLWTPPSEIAIAHNLPATPSTTAFGTRATGSATANTKGAWSQVVASTTHDVYGFWLILNGSVIPATSTNMLLDIGVGGAGEEVVLVPDLMVGWIGTATQATVQLWIPLFIPKGTRVSVRCQGQIASDTIDCMFYFILGRTDASQIFTGCHAYGIATASSNGTAHTPGSTGTESAWANIGTTLTRNYGAVMPMIHGGTTAMTAIAYHWEVGISSVTLAEWYTMFNTNEYYVGPFPGEPFRVALPSGAQLQVRAEGSGTAVAQAVGLYCFY